MRKFGMLTALCLAIGLMFSSSAWAQQVATASKHNVSEPLSEIIKRDRSPVFQGPQLGKNRWDPKKTPPAGPDKIDPYLQSTMGTRAPEGVGVNFEGVSDDDNAALLGFAVVPPDTQGDVGPNHYVQHVNLSAEIFDKAGNSLTGPFPGNDFFAGLGSNCETANDGDPITVYDEVNDRWVITQFEAASPFSMCVAVSTGPDPLGTYNQYEFNYGIDFPDYPKVGLWQPAGSPAALVVTDRSFENLFLFEGMFVSVMDYDVMVTGGTNPAFIRTQVPGGTGNDGWLPADNENTLASPPPAGSPALLFGHDGGATVEVWEADYDFGAGTLSLTNVATLASTYDEGLGNVLQPSPGESLDVLTFAAMNRLQYRNDAGVETMVVSANVDAGGDIAGMKWWELQNTGTGWTIFQEGTYAPADGVERWMGSIAKNGAGELAMCYNVASTSVFPGIRCTGQTADQAGTGIMNVDEFTIIDGGGVQTGSSNRWGDYSAMQIDPTDDATFWFTGEYYANTGSFDFKTRIASLTLDPPAPSDLTLTLTPTTSTDIPAAGGSYSYDLSITNNGTADETLNLFIGVNRADGTNIFTRGPFGPTVGAGATLTRSLTQTVPAGAPAGTYEHFANSGTASDSFNWTKLAAKAGEPVAIGGEWTTNADDVFASDDVELPAAFTLEQNYPNPFNPGTMIRYQMSEASTVSITVHNTLGQVVATLVDGYQEAGAHQVYFDASNLSAGVYLYTIRAEGFVATKQMTLLK